MPLDLNKQVSASTTSNKPHLQHSHKPKTENGSIVQVTAPRCDWLTLTAPISVSDVFQSATSQGDDPWQYLQWLVQDARTSIGQTLKKGAPPELAFKFKTRMAGYSTGHKRLGPDTASTGFYIANKPNKDNTSFGIRIDLNPARLGPVGLSELDTIFTVLFGQELSFYKWLARAKFTRIDVAVDILNLSVHDLIFRENETSKWSGWHDAAFGLETFTRLKKSSQGKWVPDIRVYDKAKELESKGKASSYGEHPVVRIEARKLTTRRFKDLANYPNPFEPLALGYLPEAALGMPRGFRNFVHASMRVGVARALEDVLPSKREDFVAAYNANSAAFWKPENLWHAWSDGLAAQGLLKLVKIANAKFKS